MNFSRKELKDRAKEFLRLDYFSVLMAMLIVILPSFIIQLSTASFRVFSSKTLLFIFITPLILGIFVIPAIEVGVSRYLLDARTNGNYDYSNIFCVFTSSNYFNVIKIMFLRNFKIALWSLLLLIPGVIKSYEYRFVPFVLARDLGTDGSEVFRKTRDYTDNNKLDMFVLDLSFIGWAFLGTLMYGLLAFFIAPYIQATNMELYLELSSQKEGY